MQLALDIFYLIALVLGSPWLAYRHLRRRRRGSPDGVLPPDAPRAGVWLHGSSVGEISLLRPLVALMQRRRPGLPVIISSHTATGVEAARRTFPECTVFKFPVDLSPVQRRIVRRLEPRLIVIVESDLWPNHLLAARAAGVPLAIVNGKLSQRSYRLHRFSRLVPRALRGVALVAVQSEEHAGRFAGLGVPRERIVVTGNMKYDLTADEADADRRRAIRAELGFADDEIVIIGGSLHPREDLDLLAAFAASRGDDPSTRLILVPRYPDQAQSVMRNARETGCEAALLSELEPGANRDVVIVVDRLGELRRLYGAADIAFVGGSLYYRGANKGGHNLMEPAILGLPVLFGPHNFSFRETVGDLLAADAGIEVHDRSELVAALGDLVGSRERRIEMGERARQVVLANQGASLRNLELLLPLIGETASCRGIPDDAQCRHQTLESLLNE